MRNKCLIFALLLLTFCAADSLAQQPGCPSIESVSRERLGADDYTELQEKASEQLKVEILTVSVWRSHRQNTYNKKVFPNLPPVLKSDEVAIDAKVIEVKKSEFGLKSGDTITIYYTTNQNYEILIKVNDRTAGGLKYWEAINPLLMEVNREYKVFVDRVQVKNGTDTDNGYRYVPAAYSKSFEEVEAFNKKSSK